MSGQSPMICAKVLSAFVLGSMRQRYGETEVMLRPQDDADWYGLTVRPLTHERAAFLRINDVVDCDRAKIVETLFGILDEPLANNR